MPGKGHIRIPTCIETNIKLEFPGDGNFVGFRARPGNMNDDE